MYIFRGCNSPFSFLSKNENGESPPLLESPQNGRETSYTHTHLKYIEDIYFFEVNTKYISSNVMKISVNSRVRSTSEFSDIFNT